MWLDAKRAILKDWIQNLSGEFINRIIAAMFWWKINNRSFVNIQICAFKTLELKSLWCCWLKKENAYERFSEERFIFACKKYKNLYFSVGFYLILGAFCQNLFLLESLVLIFLGMLVVTTMSYGDKPIWDSFIRSTPVKPIVLF